MSDDLSLIKPQEPEFQTPQEAAMLTEREFLNQFILLIYYVNPLKDSVRVILDDGSIKFNIRREKFMKIMEDLLNENLLKSSQYILFRIRESMNIYGGTYIFDRVNNNFRELMEKVDLDRIKPTDIIEETRKPLIKEMLAKKYDRQIKQEFDDHLNRFEMQETKSFINTVNAIVRKFNKKPQKQL